MNYQTCPVYDCCGGTIIRDNGMRARCRNCNGRGVVEAPGVTPACDVNAIERAAYERGLRRGLAIARESQAHDLRGEYAVRWDVANVRMEREIEEAKR